MDDWSRHWQGHKLDSEPDQWPLHFFQILLLWQRAIIYIEKAFQMTNDLFFKIQIFQCSFVLGTVKYVMSNLRFIDVNQLTCWLILRLSNQRVMLPERLLSLKAWASASAMEERRYLWSQRATSSCAHWMEKLSKFWHVQFIFQSSSELANPDESEWMVINRRWALSMSSTISTASSSSDSCVDCRVQLMWQKSWAFSIHSDLKRHSIRLTFVFAKTLICYLRLKLNMENAGSPVTSCEMDKNGGRTSFRWLLGKVVNVSNNIKPRHRGWQGSLQIDASKKLDKQP